MTDKQIIKTKKDFIGKYLIIPRSTNKMKFKRVKKKFNLLGYKNVWWKRFGRNPIVVDNGRGHLCFCTDLILHRGGLEEIGINEFLKEESEEEGNVPEFCSIYIDEPITFKDAFMALHWLMENDGKEIEFTENGIKLKVRYNDKRLCFEYYSYKTKLWKEDNSLISNLYMWDNIKEYIEEEELVEDATEHLLKSKKNKERLIESIKNIENKRYKIRELIEEQEEGCLHKGIWYKDCYEDMVKLSKVLKEEVKNKKNEQEEPNPDILQARSGEINLNPNMKGKISMTKEEAKEYGFKFVGEEPKTFKDAFIALHWLMENEGKMVEYYAYGTTWIVKFDQKNKGLSFMNDDGKWSLLNNNSADFQSFLIWTNIKEYIPEEEPKQEEKPFWSKCGMALRSLNYHKEHYGINEHHKADKRIWLGKYANEETISFGNTFQTKERAELERDRREVDYIMKKMTCESNKIADWRVDKTSENFYIKFDSVSFYIDSEIFAHKYKPYVTFNQAYFNREAYAQSCLDFLLEKYGETKLKSIWGIK